MRLGLWGARMDNSGLGQQTFEFYRHMNPNKVVVIDISMLEKTPERRLKQYPERYIGTNLGKPNAEQSQINIIHGIPQEFEIRQFLNGLDVVFIAESAYNMSFYQIARQMGVKTAVQYNYEFFDWFGDSIWEVPDLFIAPTLGTMMKFSHSVIGKKLSMFIYTVLLPETRSPGVLLIVLLPLCILLVGLLLMIETVLIPFSMLWRWLKTI